MPTSNVANTIEQAQPQASLQKSLQLQEERYRNLVEMSPDAIFVNYQNRLVYVNPAFMRLMGASEPQQLLGKSPFDFTHPDYHEMVAERIKQIREEGQRLPMIEQKIVRLDGEVRDVEVVASPFPYEEVQEAGVQEGKIAIQAILRDITQRKAMEESLRRANSDLERLVQEQTSGLLLANHALQAEIEERKEVETQLRQSEQRFRAIFDQTYELIGLLQPDGILIEANQQSCDFVGVRLSEVVGQSFWELPWWNHSTVIQAQLQEAIVQACQGHFVRFETLHPRVDGTMADIDFSLKPVYDENGQVILLIPEGREISQIKQVEHELRQVQSKLEDRIHQRTAALAASQARMSGIINSAMDAIITIDEEQRILLFNPAAQQMFGYEAAALIGQPMEQLLPERLRGLHHQHIQTFGHTHITRRRMGALGTLVGQRVNGEEFPIEASISQVQIEDKKLFSVILRDISERVQAEESLRKSERRNRALLQAIPDAIYRVNRDGTYLDYKAPTNFTTIQPSETLVGKRHQEFLPIHASQLLSHAIEQALFTQQLQEHEVELTIEGQLYTREVRVTPSGVDEVTVIIRDITEQKKREEATQQAILAERNRLARELHDSVTQTLFAASMIADVLPALWQRNRAKAEKHLSELNQLNRGALAEMRTLLLELRPAALLSAESKLLWQQLADALHGRARIPVHLQLEIETEPPSDLKIALYRITQEVFNNIAKHSEATQVNVLLRSQSGDIFLQIEDNGIGFLHKGITSEHLGLRIMQERAQEMHANLAIESHPDQGTRIMVRWPREKQDKETRRQGDKE